MPLLAVRRLQRLDLAEGFVIGACDRGAPGQQVVGAP